MSFIAEAMYWFHFLANQRGHILLNLDGKPDLAIFDVWEDSSTKLPFLVRSELLSIRDAKKHATTPTQERERERERETELLVLPGSALSLSFVKKPCL